MRFGDDNFCINIEGFEPAQPLGDSQIAISLGGRGWAVGSERTETLGVVVPRLVSFGQNGRARHWAAFADATTPEEIVDRVRRHVFSGTKAGNGEPRRWDISSALFHYVISSIFDANLGVSYAIAVRGLKFETFLIQTEAGPVTLHDVPIASFDRAIGELATWANTHST